MSETIQLILTFIYSLTIIGTVVVVISENRNPIRTLSWVMILILLPVVGLICYYFFGQDTRKMKNISVKYQKQIKKHSFDKILTTDKTKIYSKYLPLMSLLEKTSNSPVLYGSEVEIIIKGSRKFAALMTDLENAKHHIHMEYFIFYNDETGNMVKEMLMKKASEGIEVRFLYDNVANWMVPEKYYQEMTKSGVQVSSFMEVKLAAFHSKVNYRNHRKVVVIDGKIGYMGGMNVSNNYNDADFAWRDTHIRISGKGVHGLQVTFLTDWCSSGKPLIKDKIYYPECDPHTNNLMQISTGGPVSDWQNLLLATVQIVTNAKKYVYIQTPYFLPTNSLLQALQITALGGVDIRLMVSKKSDSSYVDWASKSYYEELMNSGLRIYELQDQFIHAKTMVVDDFISVVGSANMDFRSFESNFEINCYMYDKDISLKMKDIFIKDMKGCKIIELKEWKQRPWYKKILESVMRLFAPLM